MFPEDLALQNLPFNLMKECHVRKFSHWLCGEKKAALENLKDD